MRDATQINGDGIVSTPLRAQLASRNSAPDAAQVAALVRLDRLAAELAAFRKARASHLRRVFAPPEVPRGVYLWGGVGRGKSLLMDAFFAAVPIRRKTRVHFHAFMRDVHAELAKLKREADPLITVAQKIAKRWRLIAFDEFHVADIADAMILGRLLRALFEQGVVFVLTSNYPPEGLYPNGLQRQKFLPAIAQLRESLDIVEVNGAIDYRLRALEQASVYHVPADAAAEAALAGTFDALAQGHDESKRLTIEGRTIEARRRAGSVVWFDFAALCEGPRSQRDYLELALRFAVLLISGVPRMGPSRSDAARRFTWLVDILYDHRVKLVVSAEAPAHALYVEGPNVQDFPRTVSRLIEMRSHEYMSLAHVTGA
ncbi:MAG TPA: cell division protein ZapE [Casimicrobiaceae bacterium]|nr:cell division protein ZapE [Casimicrobiaceae bacterium]